MREIYDVITKQTIFLEKGKMKQIAKQFNVDYTGFCHLLNKENMFHFAGRFILPKNKNKIFTLIELDSGKEYDCITNKTIFIYFNLKNTENEIKYIYELKRKRQHVANVCGKVFYLKSNGYPKIKRFDTKNSKIIEELKLEKKHQYKIRRKIRGFVSRTIKRRNYKKLNKTEKILGCSIQFLLGYLESKFTKGMNWENYGEWHIDHIVPCNKFNLNILEEQYKCFHYSNLRPLWSTTEIAIKYGEKNNYIGNLNRKRF